MLKQKERYTRKVKKCGKLTFESVYEEIDQLTQRVSYLQYTVDTLLSKSKENQNGLQKIS